jgi:hypothetical protein
MADFAYLEAAARLEAAAVLCRAAAAGHLDQDTARSGSTRLAEVAVTWLGGHPQIATDAF